MATMSDIAREAGVSLSTVSYALSGKRPISPKTQMRIQEAIDRLSYHPTAAARALASNRAETLAIAVPQRAAANAHVTMQFVRSMMEAGYERGVDTLLVAGEDVSRTRRVIEEGKADALIVMDLSEDDPRLNFFQSLSRSVVIIGYPERTWGLSCVDFNFREAAALCVRELVSRGATRLTLLCAPEEIEGTVYTYERRSRSGFIDATQDYGIEPTIAAVPESPEAITAWIEETFQNSQAPDGLLVHHEAALAALGRALRAADISVPEQLQVAAIAPNDVLADGPWLVSGTALPISLIGAKAVSMALDYVDNPDLTPFSQLLEPRFVAQQTTRQLSEDTAASKHDSEV